MQKERNNREYEEKIINNSNNKQFNAPKWYDEDDEKLLINLNQKNSLKKLKKSNNEDNLTASELSQRLREQFTTMNSKADIYKWAFNDINNDIENNISTDVTSAESIDALLKTNKDIIDKNIKLNDTSFLEIKPMQDLNKEHQHNSIITSIEFSPSKNNLAITAGLDKKLKIFSVNETENVHSNIHTVNTIDMPIFSAKFLNNKEVIISGRRQHFFTFNIENNKLERCNGLFPHHKEVKSLEKLFVGGGYFAFGTNEGNILIYDANNKTYRYNIEIPGSVNSVCFNSNGLIMYAVGDQSEIYVYDLRRYRNCVNKFNDSGNFNTLCMNLSKDNNYLATSSNSGIVNLYSVEDIWNANKDIEPIKVLYK